MLKYANRTFRLSGFVNSFHAFKQMFHRFDSGYIHCINNLSIHELQTRITVIVFT